MSTKTRVLHVRVVGFSAPERQMLNSIFLLSVAPARQIGYKLWNPETGVAPDMYLLDGDSESAVASWQATFASTADRTLVVGGKNTDLGVAAASRPLGLKVVGAMDRLAIALNNVAREPVGHDVSAPSASASLPAMKADESAPAAPPRLNMTLPRPAAAAPSLSASMNAMAPPAPAASSLSASSHAMTASSAAPLVHAGTMPTAMTAAAPAAAVLPQMTLQPNVAPVFDKSINEKTVTDKTVDKILSDKPMVEKPMVEKPVADKALADKPAVEKPVIEKPAVEKPVVEKTAAEKINAAAALIATGVTPLSPSALSAAIAPSPQRADLRVVRSTSPLAASLPSAARIADAPVNAPAPASAPVAPAPVVAPAAAVPAPAPVMPASVPTPRHEEHNFRVLAVDDSPLMRTFLQNKLQPYGIQPEFASSGEEALFKISKQHFDMIFLDVMLPGMDGYDVCKMIKKNKDNSLMKVVMLTSKDKTFDKIRGTMAGCDGYLTKPVDELKLRAIIERHTVTKK